MTEQSSGYVRRLGTWDATMMVVGGIIGAGIFLNPAIVAQRTASGAELLLAWVIGGVLALIGALCFAELGVRRPQTGGGYVYLREAFGPLVAFLYGWLALAVVGPGAIAAVGVTFATYACAALALPTRFIKPVTVAALILLAGINWFGIRAGSVVQNLFTVLKLLAVAALVGAALWASGFDGFATAVSSDHGLHAGRLGAVLLPVLFSYAGWVYINNIAGEVRKPKRTLPRALGVGMLLVVSCYAVANLAYMSVLGHEGLANAPAPASAVLEQVMGPIGARLMAAGIAVSTFGFCNIALLSTARIFQVMGADGVFFRVAGRLHPRWRSPDIALAMLTTWAIVLALSGTYGQLLDFAASGDWLGSALVVATLFYYRGKRQDDAVSYRVPLYPWLPGLFIVTVLWVVAETVVARPTDAGACLLLLLLGIPIYLVWQRLSRRKFNTDN